MNVQKNPLFVNEKAEDIVEKNAKNHIFCGNHLLSWKRAEVMVK